MTPKDQILTKVKDTVTLLDPTAKVIVFGSFARGENRKDSDLDLIILLNKKKITRIDEKRIKYPLYDIEFESGQVISPLVLSKSDWETRHKITPFYQNVVSEGFEL